MPARGYGDQLYGGSESQESMDLECLVWDPGFLSSALTGPKHVTRATSAHFFLFHLLQPPHPVFCSGLGIGQGKENLAQGKGVLKKAKPNQIKKKQTKKQKQKRNKKQPTVQIETLAFHSFVYL